MPGTKVVSPEMVRQCLDERPDFDDGDLARHFGWKKERIRAVRVKAGIDLRSESEKSRRSGSAPSGQKGRNKTIRVTEPAADTPWQEPIPDELPFSRELYETCLEIFRAFTPAEKAKYASLGPLDGVLMFWKDRSQQWANRAAQLETQSQRISSQLDDERTTSNALSALLSRARDEVRTEAAALLEQKRTIEVFERRLKSSDDARDELVAQVHKHKSQLEQAREYRKQELETTYSPEALRIAKGIADVFARSPVLQGRFPSGQELAAAALRLVTEVPGEVAGYNDVIERLSTAEGNCLRELVELNGLSARFLLVRDLFARMAVEYSNVMNGGQPSVFAPWGLEGAMAARLLYGPNEPASLLPDQQARALITRFERSITLDAIGIHLKDVQSRVLLLTT